MAVPLWIGDAANEILENWEAWQADAEQQASAAQDSEVADYVMLGWIEDTILRWSGEESE